jgi:F0F1-type ATP synthase membrane subunit a
MVEPWLRLRGFMTNGHLLFVLLLGLLCRWFRDIDSALTCLQNMVA